MNPLLPTQTYPEETVRPVQMFYGVNICFNGYYNGAIIWFENQSEAQEFKTNPPRSHLHYEHIIVDQDDEIIEASSTEHMFTAKWESDYDGGSYNSIGYNIPESKLEGWTKEAILECINSGKVITRNNFTKSYQDKRSGKTTTYTYEEETTLEYQGYVSQNNLRYDENQMRFQTHRI